VISTNQMEDVNQSDIMIDGVVLINTNWNFLTPISNVYIPLPLLLRSVAPQKQFKGNKTLRNFKSLWKMKLFKIHDLDVSLAICGNHSSIDYSLTLQKIKCALEKSRNRLSSTFTRRYHDQVCYETVKAFCIVQRDFKEFGLFFEQELQREFGSCDEYGDESGTSSLEIFFVATAFGQNSQFEVVMEHLQIDWVNCVEVIVHIARDYTLPETALFWKKETVQEMFGCKPNYTYSNIGLVGCGNFYFVPSVVKGEMCLTLVKLYSELTKHAKMGKPFYTSYAAELFFGYDGACMFSLTSREKQSCCKKLKRVKEDCEMVEKIIKTLETYTAISARLEFLMSVTGDGDQWEKIKEFGENFFNRNNWRSSDMFLKLPLSKVVSRMKLYVNPCLETIKRCGLELESSLKSERAFAFSLG